MLAHADMHRRRVSTREDLRKLGLVSMNLFRNGRPPSPETFWVEIGRTEPLRDPWGNPYRLEAKLGERKYFEWSSAGQDRSFGTADDISQPIRFDSGTSLDLTSPELDPSLDGRVNDAR